MGLFKKIAIADTFALMANAGYSNVSGLSFVDSWLTAFSYTIQLYFDFSGYSDMAIGAGLIFNIHLPSISTLLINQIIFKTFGEDGILP
jgi:D-alanyl-lipoteichoic acid acyltransferase DltB (MBOAT superfamily)